MLESGVKKACGIPSAFEAEKTGRVSRFSPNFNITKSCEAAAISHPKNERLKYLQPGDLSAQVFPG